MIQVRANHPEALAKALELRRQGLGVGAIAYELVRLGIHQASDYPGLRWHASDVVRLLDTSTERASLNGEDVGATSSQVWRRENMGAGSVQIRTTTHTAGAPAIARRR